MVLRSGGRGRGAARKRMSRYKEKDSEVEEMMREGDWLGNSRLRKLGHGPPKKNRGGSKV